MFRVATCSGSNGPRSKASSTLKTMASPVGTCRPVPADQPRPRGPEEVTVDQLDLVFAPEILLDEERWLGLAHQARAAGAPQEPAVVHIVLEHVPDRPGGCPDSTLRAENRSPPADSVMSARSSSTEGHISGTTEHS